MKIGLLQLATPSLTPLFLLCSGCKQPHVGYSGEITDLHFTLLQQSTITAAAATSQRYGVGLYSHRASIGPDEVLH